MEYFAILQSTSFAFGSSDDILARGHRKKFESPLGLEPWYAGANNYDRPIKPFPEGLVLTRRELVDNSMSVRRGSRHFYIIDDIFESSIKKLKTNFIQTAAVTPMNLNGDVLNEKCFVVSTNRVSDKYFRNVLGSDFDRGDKTIPLRLEFSLDFDFDLFDMYKISTNMLSLVCNTRAKDLLLKNGVVGVTFLPLNEYLKSVNEQALLVPAPV